MSLYPLCAPPVRRRNLAALRLIGAAMSTSARCGGYLRHLRIAGGIVQLAGWVTTNVRVPRLDLGGHGQFVVHSSAKPAVVARRGARVWLVHVMLQRDVRDCHQAGKCGSGSSLRLGFVESGIVVLLADLWTVFKHRDRAGQRPCV